MLEIGMVWHHLMLDLYGCKPEALGDKSLVRRIFEDLSKIIDLRMITEPVIIYYSGESDSPSGEGVSGFVIVAESHLSIHTDLRTNFASIDVYSCKEFDAEVVERYLIKVFGAERVERKFFLRGLKKSEIKSELERQ
ncbi:MAG TPA: S-adenosylmethionine decarboxylase proenzyme [Nitrososphaeria archaeon]|nr:S-adenosylmethionine decarboxylase proenzyme [Nitrososphaeria archaeon]